MFSLIRKIFGAPADLAPLLAKGAHILDVRTNIEFTAGHIKGSKNIP